MIIVYTGNGKGKTSASVGQALRAIGQGFRVYFAQFMKSDRQAGEQVFLSDLLKERYVIGGCGFFRKEEDRPRHRAAAGRTLAWIREHIPDCDLFVLDEVLYALKADLLTREEIEELLDLAEAHHTHLVLSGRGLPDWLRDRADTVSEIQEVKHAWQAGIKAMPGIEY